MRHENKKIGKIVDELVTFFCAYGANDISVKINRMSDRIDFAFVVDHLDENEKIVKMFEDLINFPREEDFDEVYWNLAGESDHDTELTLIAYMIDKVLFSHKGDAFEVILTRYLDRN
ncbi:MAG: hypothetical protein CR995_00220 [Clostridiales bacterium]|nr:MAG: hypothetical protein CR995_00220 [Clostridiales bacterium]